MARRPALFVNALGLDDLFHQPQLVIGIDNGEGGFQPYQFGMAAQDLGRDRVEGSHPRHALDGFADNFADPFLHFARCLVGEGDGEDLPRPRAAGGEDMGEAGGQHTGLAGAGPGEHQHGPVERLDGLALLGIEPFEIGRGRRRARHVGDGERSHASLRITSRSIR